MIIQSWGLALNNAFTGFVPALLQFAIYLFIALIIFAVGWVIGYFIGDIVNKLFKTIKVDNALRQAGLEDVLRKGDIRLDSGAFVGGLVQWFIIAVFFLSALQVLGLNDVTSYLQEAVLDYLPRVIVAVLILLVSTIIAEVLRKVVTGAAATAHLKSSRILGHMTKWAIIIFAILAALLELQIAEILVQIVFIGVVVALSLAFGLAFGLGGRDAAARLIEKTTRDITNRG